MVREDCEAWEHLKAEATDEAYMQEIHRQHLELVEAEQVIFAGAEGGEVIALSSDDEVEGGGDGGTEGVDVGPQDHHAPSPRPRRVIYILMTVYVLRLAVSWSRRCV